jgi:hypothetical protein
MGNLLAPKDFGLQGLSGHYYNQASNAIQPSALRSIYGGYTDVGQTAVMDALNAGATPDQIAQMGSELTSAGVFDGGTFDNMFGGTKGSTGGSWFSDNALGIGQIGVAGLGLINDRQQLGLVKKALQDQLKNSQMQREMTADQLRTQAGVRSSLARAFGGSTKPYEKSLGLAEKYANKDT